MTHMITTYTKYKEKGGGLSRDNYLRRYKPKREETEDWNEVVSIMQEKNDTMRQALAKMWGVEESNNKNPFDEGGHLPSEKKNKKEQKTMTGQPVTKVSVDPDMKEKKNIA